MDEFEPHTIDSGLGNITFPEIVRPMMRSFYCLERDDSENYLNHSE